MHQAMMYSFQMLAGKGKTKCFQPFVHLEVFYSKLLLLQVLPLELNNIEAVFKAVESWRN